MNSMSKQNNLSSQLHFSLFACLCANGVISLMFTEQHRMNSDICKMIFTLSYHNKLQNASEVVNSSTSNAIRIINLTSYKINSTLVFLNVINSTVIKSFDKSYQNLEHAAVTMNLMKKLFDNSISSDQLLILISYQAQYCLYLQAQLELQVK